MRELYKRKHWIRLLVFAVITLLSVQSASAVTIEGDLSVGSQVNFIFDGPATQPSEYRMDLTFTSPTGQKTILRDDLDEDANGNSVWDMLFTVSEEGTWQYEALFRPRKTSGLSEVSEEGTFVVGDQSATPFCGDGTCNGGESCGTCISDCGNCPLEDPAPFCGDGTCNGGETCGTCISDCGNCPLTDFCGDGTCMGDETCSTCAADCGTCELIATEPPAAITHNANAVASTCGNGVCSNGETESSCPFDCRAGFWELSGNGVSCGNTYTGMIPLTDLGPGTHMGEQGGLYEGGSNTRPTAHRNAVLAAADMIQPLDANGNPDPNGKIVLVTIGMSNVRDEGDTWVPQAMALADKNPNVVLISGGIGGRSSDRIVTGGDQYPSYWNDVITEIEQNGLTAKQVQVIWHKPAERLPAREFPAHAATLQGYTEDIVTNVIPDFFPNAKLVYLSSRIYAGYAEGQLNPEPQAYEGGFAVKWTIAKRSQNLLPVVTWGPYIWSDGIQVGDRGARDDGFALACSDFKADGTHPAGVGQQKVADQLTNFFTTDESAVSWFLADGSQPVLFCGDGTCNGGETCGTCIADCGNCPIEPVCGDGTIDAGEDCDGGNFGGKTCSSFGFTSGSLSCTACTISTANCFTDDGGAPDGFADPISSFTVSPTTLLAGSTGQVSLDVSIDDTLVYGLGYVSLNNGDWSVFDLSAEGHRFGNWISQGAKGTLTFDAANLVTSDANYILLYSCSWTGVSWDCRTWQMKQFSVSKTGATFCGDGTCNGGEICSTCPTDCGPCSVTPFCGDGVANQASEDCDGLDVRDFSCVDAGDFTGGVLQCASDCRLDTSACVKETGPVCGDGSCIGETCSSCPADCGICQAVCGDGKCEGSETSSTCAADCGGVGTTNFCGDWECNNGETDASCPHDCLKYFPEDIASVTKIKVCDRTHQGFIPLTDFAARNVGSYLGVAQGGLYPGGSNEMPSGHLSTGIQIANSIQPINGKICVAAIGMSNTNQKFSYLQAFPPSAMAANVVLANGGVGGSPIDATADIDGKVWDTVFSQIEADGCSPEEVQVVWFMHAMQILGEVNKGTIDLDGGFLQFTDTYKGYIKDSMLALDHHFPNLKIVYLTSRTYSGYGIKLNNPEPWAYWGAWSMKWVIQDQIENTDSDLSLSSGFPYLAWGPYTWADGENGRLLDDVTYSCSDFSDSDGIHPGLGSKQKTMDQLGDFLTTDPTAEPWFT